MVGKGGRELRGSGGEAIFGDGKGVYMKGEYGAEMCENKSHRLHKI